LERHKGADVSQVQSSGTLFYGLEFCVLAGAGVTESQPDIDAAQSKHALEKKIAEQGGSFRQGPSESSLLVADKLNVRVKNLINSGKYDIVKSEYVEQCLAQNRVLDLHPR
jgi:DNA ligase-4